MSTVGDAQRKGAFGAWGRWKGPMLDSGWDGSIGTVGAHIALVLVSFNASGRLINAQRGTAVAIAIERW